MAKQSASRTFVLVHGAWHGGWVYARLAEMLRARGHRVFTPTLTGLCERSHVQHPGINCSTHIQDVLNLMKWEQLSDVVLAGWSYGGYVVTGVADRVPDKIASLVFLDSSVPRSGVNLLEASLNAEQRAHFIGGTGDYGGLWVPPMPAKAFGIVSPADAALVDALCTPQPLGTFTERLTFSGAYKKRKTCVFGLDWEHPLRAAYERVKADKDYTVHVVPGGHHVMLDATRQVADILVASA
jgi:pimeloyl-ACP methyl ester carboxylesterase